MKTSIKFNPYITIIHLVCVFVLCYTLIIKNIFTSPDSLNTHLKQSGLYADTSNLVKERISERIDQRFADKIVQGAIAERLLDAIVTPQFIEKQSQRVLPIAAKVISQPLDIANNKVVVDMKLYKQKVTSELAENTNQIPDIIEPTANNLVASVPDQLMLVDMNQRPNSVLGFLTKAKILFENINLWNVIALTLAVVTALMLIIINRENVRRLFQYLTVAYLVSGAIVLIGSFLFPYLSMLFNNGSNIYLNKLVSDAIYYLFAQTRTPSVILLGLGGVFYGLYRWSYIDVLQTKIDHMLNSVGSVPAKKKKTSYTT